MVSPIFISSLWKNIKVSKELVKSSPLCNGKIGRPTTASIFFSLTPPSDIPLPHQIPGSDSQARGSEAIAIRDQGAGFSHATQ